MRFHMIRFLCLVVVLALGQGLSIAGDAWPLSLARLQDGQAKLVGHDGKEAIVAGYHVKRESEGDQPRLRIRWESGVERIEGVLETDGRPIRTIYDKKRTGEHIEIDYSPEGATYHYTKSGKTKISKVKQKGLVEVLLIDVMLLAFPFERPRAVVFPILNTEADTATVYTMFAKLDRIEEIAAVGGKQKAFKLALGLKGFAGLFAPTFSFWYSAETPHRYLKTEGKDEALEVVEGSLALP
jgi:hypothetical protein